MGGVLQINHVENPDFNSESYTDVKLALNGRFDLGATTSVFGELFTEDVTEDRTELSNVPTSLEPNEYSRSGGSIGFEHQASRWLVDANLDLCSHLIMMMPNCRTICFWTRIFAIMTRSMAAFVLPMLSIQT